MIDLNLKLPFFIACAGNATSGKNYFCDILRNKLGKDKTTELSFASTLKEEMFKFVKNSFGINLLDCSAEDKLFIRPLMVQYAELQRRRNPDYFIEKLDLYMNFSDIRDKINIIVDLRFENEYNWLKNDLGGLLVFIRKYSIKEHKNGDYPSDFEMILTPPANELEEQNNEFLSKNADYQVDWPHGNIEVANRVVDDFITFLQTKL